MAIKVIVRSSDDDVRSSDDGAANMPDSVYEFSEGIDLNLLEWWVRTTLEDFKKGAPKVEEYGAHDLELMGMMLGVLCWGKHIQDIFSPWADCRLAPITTELACWFYCLGKISRLVSDYLAKRPGKDDTWHDITFYSLMARRIKETGRWP